ncbi:hypothetical protein [Cesiribacter andamanensis]|uniref:Uncharacterized protein n=1 Tax=Cesiribacter andamanensis AMV16 TaxID=1279009 RepID=M7N1E3_9BACT|nr:hypothetical protein [Cesiribacter andamanensis]EMR01112.1 hypothetical protein ADICEAN_03766 [Cesiribacter andamanensis AMV16]
MICWFWNYKGLMRRLPVLMALLAGCMFAATPAGKSFFPGVSAGAQEVQLQDQTAASGEEIPVFEPGFSALAQVAPLQLFFFQPAFVPALTPLVEIVEQAPATVPRLFTPYFRTLFRQIISPNAP